MKFIYVVSLFCLFVSTNSLAYKGTKCSDLSRRNTLPIFLTSSTTSFVTSTGPCSAVGMHLKEERKYFIAGNMEIIMEETAKGGGEYLETLAYLSGCNENGKDRFSRTLQENFNLIFLSSDKSISNNIDKVIKTTDLNKYCSYKI